MPSYKSPYQPLLDDTVDFSSLFEDATLGAMLWDLSHKIVPEYSDYSDDPSAYVSLTWKAGGEILIHVRQGKDEKLQRFKGSNLDDLVKHVIETVPGLPAYDDEFALDKPGLRVVA